MTRLVVGIVAVIVVIIGVLVWLQRPTGDFYVSGIIEAEETRVGSRVGGRVREMFVDEGDRVSAGDVLVTLEPFDLMERLAEAEAALAARRSTLEKRLAGFRPEEIEQARARRDRLKAVLERLIAGPRPLEIQIQADRVDLAKAEMVNAQSEFTRVKGLSDIGRAAPQELDDATEKIDTARAKLAAAEKELALLKEGTRAEEIAEARASLAEAEHALQLLEAGYRKEEIDEAKANLNAAEATVAAIRRQVEELRITSPGDCLVDAVDLDPGDLISANAPVLTLIDPADLWVRAYVPENRLDIVVGQKVRVRVDSFPGRDFAGHIAFISRQAEFTPSNVQTPEERVKQVFRIKVVLDAGQEKLRAGMSADVYPEPQ